jgi:hypothetical protein
VALDGLARQEQLLRDLGIGCSGGDQPYDLLLAIGQLLRRGASAPGPHSERAKGLLRQLQYCLGASFGGGGDHPLELGDGPLSVRCVKLAPEVEPDP